jgi:hypothetical protein
MTNRREAQSGAGDIILQLTFTVCKLRMTHSVFNAPSKAPRYSVLHISGE